MVEIMLNYGAHVDAEDFSRRTPLYFAMRRKNWWLIQMLRLYGARGLRRAETDCLYAKYGIVEPQNYVEEDVGIVNLHRFLD